MLVHRVEAGEELARTARARWRRPARCRSRSRRSSGRPPSPRSRTRWPGRCRTRRPCRGPSRPPRSGGDTAAASASDPASIAPDARRASSSQALQSRALVSVSRVPKVLLDTMNSVVVGLQVAQGGGRVGRVDVGDEPALELGVPVGGEGLVGHHRAEVGAADPDVDDRPDPLAGDARSTPRCGPARRTRRRVAGRRARRRRRPGRRPRGCTPRAGAERGVQDRAVLGDVDVRRRANIASRRRSSSRPRRPASSSAASTSSSRKDFERSTWRSAAVNVNRSTRSGSCGEPAPQVRLEARRPARRAATRPPSRSGSTGAWLTWRPPRGRS